MTVRFAAAAQRESFAAARQATVRARYPAGPFPPPGTKKPASLRAFLADLAE